MRRSGSYADYDNEAVGKKDRKGAMGFMCE